MGSYGIGPARIVAAAVEQFADEHGISWPRALAPFDVHLVALGKPGTPERDAAERSTRRCAAAGVEVLYDDRDLGPGEKFADAELLGCPLRLTVGRRSLESGEIEVQVRRGREQAPGRAARRRARRAAAARGRAVAEPPLERAAAARGGPAAPPGATLAPPRLTFARLSGLDRSGPPPPQTQAGSPLRPVDDPERDRLRRGSR